MKLKVSGLDCANCAMDLENELKKDKRLSNVIVDFATQSISFNKQDSVSLDEIKQKILNIESDISFIDEPKTKYILKVSGLDCANCAMELEEELSKDKRLTKVVVDFAMQKIIFEADANINLDDIKKEIVSIESDVKFIDDTSSKIKKSIYKVEGLDCANCAMDFEKELNKQPEIEHAVVDFAQSKLIVEYNERNFDVIQKVASSMEDNIIVSKDTKSSKDLVKSDIDYSLIWSILIALVILLATKIFNLDGNYKIAVLFIAYLIAGYDVLIKLVKNLIKGKVFDENFLMGIATVAAFAIGEYTEAIAVMVFYKVGEFMQQLAVNNSRKSISDLMDIKAEYANLLINGEIKEVDPSNVKVGELVVIKPGEKIPLDGRVIEGTSYLDTKALTGESKAVKVSLDDEVLSGSINTDSVITVEVTKEFSDSTVAKILDLVENSSANKAPTENFITKFARIYTPIVVLIAAAVAMLPPLLLNQEFYPWIYKALIFLVISCPCALVISIPLGFFGGVGNASKHGVLIKGANYLEALNYVDTVVFDKTGTLTKGDFSVVEVKTYNGMSEEELLEYAAYAEQYSNHPIATSIKEAYNNSIDLSRISDYQEISGQGIKVKVDGKIVLAGNYLLLDNNNIAYDKVDNTGTIVLLACDNKYIGYIVVADEIKEDTIKGLQELKQLGISELIMLTGDNEQVANEVAKKVGITKVFAKLLPNDKVNKFEEIEQNKGDKSKVIFVGDGINDAPVLARADIGVAMGGVGSDAAIESADMVIMSDEISKIATSIKIANFTKKIVNQNIVLAFVVKLAALTLGLFGMAAVWEAVIADVGVAIVAIFNAMRILKMKGD